MMIEVTPEGEMATATDEIRVITNNVPRDIVDAYELTLAERVEFDYLDWDSIDQGSDSATFLRYRGVTYDLGEFQTTHGLPVFNPLARDWDGYHSDSFFSGIVVRYVNDFEQVIVGTFLA
jgi:hypothetical protein